MCSLSFPCAGAQGSVPTGAPASQGGDHEVRPAIVAGVQQVAVAIPTLSVSEDH